MGINGSRCTYFECIEPIETVIGLTGGHYVEMLLSNFDGRRGDGCRLGTAVALDPGVAKSQQGTNMQLELYRGPLIGSA